MGFRPVRQAARAIVLLGVLFALTTVSAGASEEVIAPDRSETEVLTLEEAAQLLRVPPEDLEAAARRGEAPGRKIGKNWRFYRSALMRWLAGVDELPVSTDELVKEELVALRGRGPEEQGREDQTVGEAPTEPTAEEVFLREQLVLLRRGELTVEPRISYSIREESEIAIVDFFQGPDQKTGVETVVLLPGIASLEQNTTNASLALRYGILDETELFARFRFQHQQVSSDNIEREPSDDGESEPSDNGKSEPSDELSGLLVNSESSNDLSGFFVGARRTLFKERANIPAVVLSVEGYLPINDSSYSIGTALWAVKSFDPVAVFAGFEYRHTFSRDFDQVTLLEAEDTWGITLGYSFAVNDELLLSTAVSAAFASSSEFSLGTLQSEQDYALRFGLTRLFQPGFYIEPSVTIGLTGPNWVSFGLSMPFTLIR